jgi:pilus assembly protein Flp/PilA
MLSYLYAYLSTFFQDEEGQGMAEYGLILALVAVALVAGFIALQGGIDGVLTSVTASF